ncbi:porin [Salmonella enterica subsp. enterica serovar Typhimurium]|nr:porin [Salmonella enterica subsp. enterica serovar Typhimurium]
MKSKVALAVFGALALTATAHAAEVYKDKTTDINVYGFVNGEHYFVEHGKKNGFDGSEAQLGVKAKQQLNDQFALFGQYEGRVKAAQHGQKHRLQNRQAWAGIDANEYGAVTIGRQNGLIYDVSGLSDMAVNLSGMGASSDTALLGRSDGIIQYANTFDFVKVIGQYKMSQTSDSFETGLPVNQGQAYGAAVLLTDINGTGLGGGLGYAHGDAGDASVHNGAYVAQESDTYTGALTYIKGPVYAAATTVVGKNIQKVKSYYDDEVYVQYAFDNGIAPAINYTSTNAGAKHQEYVEPDITYSFNKNVSTGVGYGIDVTGDNDNVVKTFLKYQF